MSAAMDDTTSIRLHLGESRGERDSLATLLVALLRSMWPMWRGAWWSRKKRGAGAGSRARRSTHRQELDGMEYFPPNDPPPTCSVREPK